MKTDKLLTTKAILQVFGVTTMCIYHWRQLRDLPVKQEGHRIWFDPKAVKSWAKRNNVPCLVDPLTLVGVVQETKRGPKKKPVLATKSSSARRSKTSH